MDLLSAGDGGSRSLHSLLWHQWVAAIEMQPRRVMKLHDKRGRRHPATVPPATW
jgi:L-amino acid N-acyltransferase YncA